MANDGLRDRLFTEARVLRQAGWNGIAATMSDAHRTLSDLNSLLASSLRHVKDPDLATRIAAALMNGGGRTAAPAPDPDHPEVGQLFCSDFDKKTYRCDGFTPDLGFLMSAIDSDNDPVLFVSGKHLYSHYQPVEPTLTAAPAEEDESDAVPAPGNR